MSAICCAASWSPPTVSDTKAAFYENFKKPIPPIYNTVIQELLVQQHLMRWNKNYQFDEVFALGFVSVFDQILEGLPEPITQEVFKAYVDALQEDPQQFRSGAERVEAWTKELSSSADLKPDANGSDIQKMLAGVASRSQEKKFSYNKFFAIGLFRMLELTGAKDPKALKALVESVHINLTTVNRDLTSYKGILSKLSAAKELMAELTQRERRKQAERDAEKAEKLKKDNEKSEEKLPADANA
eukprot:jgi/Astpho2/3171/Aster-05704